MKDFVITPLTCKTCGMKKGPTILGDCEECYMRNQESLLPRKKETQEVASPKIYRCVVTYHDGCKEIKGYGVLFESGEVTVCRMREGFMYGVAHFDSIAQIVSMFGACLIKIEDEE